MLFSFFKTYYTDEKMSLIVFLFVLYLPSFWHFSAPDKILSNFWKKNIFIFKIDRKYL